MPPLDAILKIGDSLVQHGPANDRVYLMKPAEKDLPGIAHVMDYLARDKGYSKIFARIPAWAEGYFSAMGFVSEACVPGMYKGEAPGHFMSKYLEAGRTEIKTAGRIAEVLETAVREAASGVAEADAGEIVRLFPKNAEELAGLYARVFDTYPFPVDDPDYIRNAMASGVTFLGIYSEAMLVAAASAEKDMDWRCAEMTDFATLPEFWGRGVASKLLINLEKNVIDANIATAYTIARAESFGMNIVFARNGYSYAGTLRNNTQIAGKLESMNVWFKPLKAQTAR